MKIERQGDTLRVSAIKQLGASNANAFQDWVCEEMMETERNIDIDLAQTNLVDSCGLGALVSLQKAAEKRRGTLRLLNVQPPVRQILELTRMNAFFEIG